ncbi:HAD family hydrolase [Halobiforma nitratireducens]|uniref:Haloacid dehalogenase n=1 Tax=Halobiforma nitratireducens JCM 10879 TaxID=1227454 RepID=M0MLD8_9EURY|nr:HAD family hydrolase [Halobiforma nitratireducens]EMA45270.1 haloacid dehalogenase [Halobiforma nitratireducens JCM 10879]
MTDPILFDMDGIILDGRRTAPAVYANAADAAIAELGLEPDTDLTSAQQETFRHGGPDAIIDCCEELGIDPDRFWKLKEQYASRGTHERLRTGERGTYPDIDVIRDLSDRLTIGLVSNNRHQTAAFVADYYDFSFDIVRGRDPTLEGYRRRKPEPYYIEDALSKLETEHAAETVIGDGGGSTGLYVGDSPKDVVAGTAAGLETAFVRRPHNDALERPPDATYELESLSGLFDIVDCEG